jgi:hypothetical protein
VNNIPAHIAGLILPGAPHNHPRDNLNLSVNYVYRLILTLCWRIGSIPGRSRDTARWTDVKQK